MSQCTDTESIVFNFQHLVFQIILFQILTNAFRYRDRLQNGWITIGYEDFLSMAFSLNMSKQIQCSSLASLVTFKPSVLCVCLRFVNRLFLGVAERQLMVVWVLLCLSFETFKRQSSATQCHFVFAKRLLSKQLDCEKAFLRLNASHYPLPGDSLIRDFLPLLYWLSNHKD